MSVAYPSPTVVVPATRVRPPSGGTAESLILAGLILQVIGGVFLLGGIAWFFGFSILHPFADVTIAVIAAGVVAVLAVLFLYFVYTLCYERAREGQYARAEAPTLVLGILSLFFGIVPGILYLIAYVKLGDATREQQGYLGGPSMPLVACRGCGRVYGVGQFGFCPGCGQKLGA
jgi:hypothetical protein